MTVFVYDNTKIDEFVAEDAGLITVGHATITDYGDINQTAIIERDANYFNVDEWGRIIYDADIVPFGPINVVDGRDEFGRSRSQVIFPADNTVLYDVGAAALTNPVRPWIGSGTIFEIGHGLERLVIPDLGAAGPVIFYTTGVANESFGRAKYTGSGVVAQLSQTATTDLDQVYPYAGSGTGTFSGGTSTPYQDAYLPTIKNAAKIKGGARRGYQLERVVYEYSRDPYDVWDSEDNGVVTVREGSSFDDQTVTFDDTVVDTNAKERSFSDVDQLTYADYGSITASHTSEEDRGVIERKFGGQISLHEYQAWGISASESRPFHYTGSGSIFKLAESVSRTTPCYTGSGTITASGTNWFSQAPQSTIFGLEGKAEISGSAEEKFVPSTPASTVLYGISGTGAEAIVAQTPDNKALIRLTGSVSGVAIVTGSGDKSGTVLFDVSGGATKVSTAKADGNINLFDIIGGMRQGIPVYTPHWKSPKGDLKTAELDWGSIVATPTQPSEDWNVIVTNDETIPKVAENWGFLLPDFNWAQLGGQHYPNLDSFSTGDSSWTIQTNALTETATLLLSEDPDVAAAIAYESSGKSGIATHNAGIFISGELWLSQAPQHTVFGEEGQFTFQGGGAESITPWIPEGSGSLFTLGGSSESSVKSYLQGDYSYLGGTAGQTFSPHIDNTIEITLRTGREPGQTYARVVDTPELEFGGDINVRGGAIKVSNVDSYNESSIFIGQTDEDWGILASEPSYGFSLNALGQASGTETYDDEGDTFDQDITFASGGLTYDQGSGGVTILPSFDKTDQYDITFADTTISSDWGNLGISSAGGPDYGQILYPSNTGFVQQDINHGYDDHGWVNEESPTANRYPFGSVYYPQPVPKAKTMWIPSWNRINPNADDFTIWGGGIERVAVASSTTTLFDFVGTSAPERVIYQTPDNTVLYEIDGISGESYTRDFVGSGSIALTQTQAVGFTTYRRVIMPPSSGITTITGGSTEKWSGDPPEGTYLHIFRRDLSIFEKLSFACETTKAVQRLSGELTHPDIDFTPHYGIDRNIGIETGFTLKPGGGEDRITGITTASFVPSYPGGQSALDGFNGHTREVIKIDGRSISRTNAPISTHGVIYILGIGTAGNGVGGPDEKGDLEGVEFGAKERFIPATEYGYGSLMFDFTGGAQSREINVFGYYGNDRDPGTSGQLTIRQEGGIYTLEKITKIYETDGTGAYTYNGGATDEATTFTEVGTGSLYSIGGSSENVAAAELVAGTSIFNGTAEESFVANTPENTATVTLSGTGLAQRRFEPVGSGTITLRGDINPITGVRLSAYGSGSLFGFGSGAEAVPYQGFASSVLSTISGSAETREIAVYQDFVTSGSLTFAGVLAHPLIDFTPATTGGGFSTFFGSAETVTTPREVGVGTFTVSGTAIPRFASQAGEGTVLFDLKGASAITKLHWLYSPTASGVATISGDADEALNQVYGYYGDDKDPGTSGGFTFSNTPLVHPFVDYTPSIGIGKAVLYNVSGGSREKRAWAPVYGSGSFKKLASVQESYGRATYVGVGRIQSYGVAPTEYLVFEEGRIYVVII